MSLTVKLEIYEGPLDLLLHLIRKNEVDIYDIPIALITEQYLEYLKMMESMNMEVAGEFLLMAATLTQIKSKLLLPRIEDGDEEDEEDPRMAIVRPLLEHMKLRDAAEALERRDVLNRDVFTRAVDFREMGLEPEEENLIEANLFDLIDAFRQIATRFDKKTGLEIVLETKTIQERITEIMRLLNDKGQAPFVEICATDKSKADLVLSFLSILELARVGHLRIYQNRDTKELTLFVVEERPFIGVVELTDNYDGSWPLDRFDEDNPEDEEAAE